jgi:hypothetical protein
MSIHKLCLLPIVLLASACAQFAAQSALTRYQFDLNPIIGTATREDIAQRYGPPKERQRVGASEEWTYHISHGYSAVSRVSPFIPPHNPNSNAWGIAFARGETQSREQYDLLTLRFRNDGALDSWRVYVQR